MDKTEELNTFLARADELIESKYIVADIKIVNLLKSIASSETLLAIFKNCLTDFDFEDAKKKYLVKSEYLSSEKGEFILPDSSREILAFIFCVLMAIDAKEIELSDFIKKYFYEDGSYSAGFATFVNAMIKPFRNTVKSITESVIEGKIQDPIEALSEEEERRKREEAERRRQLELARIKDPTIEVRNKIRIGGIIGKEVFIGDKIYTVGKVYKGAKIVDVRNEEVVFLYKGHKFKKKVQLK